MFLLRTYKQAEATRRLLIASDIPSNFNQTVYVREALNIPNFNGPVVWYHFSQPPTQYTKLLPPSSPQSPAPSQPSLGQDARLKSIDEPLLLRGRQPQPAQVTVLLDSRLQETHPMVSLPRRQSNAPRQLLNPFISIPRRHLKQLKHELSSPTSTGRRHVSPCHDIWSRPG